jgi:hypothetical protein
MSEWETFCVVMSFPIVLMLGTFAACWLLDL